MNIPSSLLSSLLLQFCIIVAGFYFVVVVYSLSCCFLYVFCFLCLSSFIFLCVLIHFVFFTICESNHNCSLCTLNAQRHHIWAHKKGIRVTHLVLLLFIRQSTNVNYANVWYTLKSIRLENACIWRHFNVIFVESVRVRVFGVCVWQFQCSLWARYTACTEHQTPNTQPNQCNAMHIWNEEKTRAAATYRKLTHRERVMAESGHSLLSVPYACVCEKRCVLICKVWPWKRSNT